MEAYDGFPIHWDQINLRRNDSRSVLWPITVGKGSKVERNAAEAGCDCKKWNYPRNLLKLSFIILINKQVNL
jgi:hypothetical protein